MSRRRAKRCGVGDRFVALGAALGDVAVEQVEAAGVAQLLDFPEEAEDGDGRVFRSAGAQVVTVGVDERGLVAGLRDGRRWALSYGRTA